MDVINILSENKLLFAEVPSNNKKVDAMVAETNLTLASLFTMAKEVEAFLNSQLSGERNALITSAKSLAKYYEGNKLLKVETLVEKLRAEEQAELKRLASHKEKALVLLNNLKKATKTDAVTSNYDLYGEELTRCEEGHEVLILGEHSQGVIDTVISEVTNGFVYESNFDQVEASEYVYSMETIQGNASLCEAKINEMFGAKPDKVAKHMAVVEKMIESAKQVVAFYTAKELLTKLGCNPKGLKAYETALSKAYIPYKKTLEKTLKVELADICAIEIDEDPFMASEDMPNEPLDDLTQASSMEVEEDASEETTETEVNKLSSLAESLKNLRGE